MWYIYTMECWSEVKWLSRVWLFVTPWTVATRLLPWDFPGKSTGVGCHFLLQRIFPIQGLNPGLPHYRQTLYHLSHQVSALLLSHKKKWNCTIWRNVDGPRVCHTEWSKSERERQISYINAYMWNLDKWYVLSCFSHVQLFVTLWTVACQTPLSMGFSRQEYWSGLSFPLPGDLPDPGHKL